MKGKVLLFVLVGSLMAFGQGRGRGGGPPAGVGPMEGGPPAGVGSMGSAHDHGPSASESSHSGPQSPDQLLTQNTRLASTLQALLPKNMTPQQACANFKNLGQCVAAIHVAHNLGIPFTDLQAKLTGSHPESLGKAIQDLSPNANVKAEVGKAKKQAHADLKQSNS